MTIRTRLNTIQRIQELLGVRSAELALLVVLGLVSALFEAGGIGVLIPLLAYVEEGPQVFERNPVAAATARLAEPFGLAPSLLLLFVAAFIPVVGRQLFRFLRQIYAGRVRFAAMARLRHDGVRAVLDADLPFVLARGQAQLAGTLTTEVERCAIALPMFLQLIESVLLIGMYLLVLMFLATPLVPVVVVAMCLAALTIRVKVRQTERLGHTVTAGARRLQVAVTERLIGFRLVKLRASEAEEAAYLGRIIDELSASLRRISRVKEALNAAVEPIMILGVFAALYVAVDVLGIGLASIGVFGLIVTRMVPLLRQLNDAWLGVAALTAGLHAISGQMQAARAASCATPGGRPFRGLTTDLVFDGVGFRYDDVEGRDEERSAWALRDVSFRVEKGSLTAIVGRSGAGKSTLLDLVPRLRSVTQGRVLIDGIPVERYDVTTLRRGIGFVDQQGFLFDATIAENIAYGVEGATTEAIVEAARRAHAAEFIERLPDGYATRTGDQGHRLSVGQRQRICIARVLLQDPDILLLDEPTSALDGESEEYIRAVVDQLHPRKAIVVVGHRLSAVRGADQIVVLEAGRVVERGTHAALVAQLGTYHQLFELQAQ